MINNITDIAFNEETVFTNMKEFIDLKGKRVLEIGGNFNEELVRKNSVLEWICIDPRKEDYISEDGIYKCYKMPLLDFELKNNYFDFAFSSNAFEHVSNLKQCLAFIYESLKDGGKLFAHYGPIWSAPDGHHLEDVILSDKSVVNFWENNFIPNWYHLIYSKNQLKTILMDKFSYDDATTITEYIYENPYLNRLFFKEYINMFLEAKFKINFLKTTNVIDYKLQQKFQNNYTYKEARDILERLYGNDDYDCRDIMVLLEK